jgi:hypothetical protein
MFVPYPDHVVVYLTAINERSTVGGYSAGIGDRK